MHGVSEWRLVRVLLAPFNIKKEYYFGRNAGRKCFFKILVFLDHTIAQPPRGLGFLTISLRDSLIMPCVGLSICSPDKEESMYGFIVALPSELHLFALVRDRLLQAGFAVTEPDMNGSCGRSAAFGFQQFETCSMKAGLEGGFFGAIITDGVTAWHCAEADAARRECQEESRFNFWGDYTVVTERGLTSLRIISAAHVDPDDQRVIEKLQKALAA